MSYLREQFIKFIPRDSVKTIFEIGSRDALDAIAVTDYYKPDRTFVFEPNPPCVELCRKNLAGRSDIELVEAAAAETSGTMKFYSVVESYQQDGSSTNNIGASSLLKSSGLYGEKYIQKEVEVRSLRIDEFCAARGIAGVDLVCMDVQGAEISVLRSFGVLLRSVNYIITEATVVNQYEGQAQLHHINDFLVSSGFNLVSVDMGGYWGYGNFFYIHSKIAVPIVGS